ncbi:MAG: glyceraldehyde-3-phosphate dehydrogenase [Actinobacteria bacterium]|nr:glyceraldehyde-3-phosphate dehydrogenase [Actinomycetota bacterium]
MDKFRVGLMGFGRIGRNVFRQLEGHPSIEVAAIVDIADPEALVYLLRYDTIFGRFPKPIGLANGSLTIGDRSIPMLKHADPKDVDWAAYGVDVVVQATTKHRTVAECQGHLDNGAGYVILATVPDDPSAIETLVMGVNDEVLDSGDRIISLGSNTSNALAPVLKILDDEFGIDSALYTTVHAYTNTQRLADVPGDSLRLSRAAAENIIPGPTNSPEIIERVLPAVKGKLAGMALNVPVPDGSTVDLVAFLEKPVTRESVNAAIKKAAADSRILEYTEEPVVSSDVIGNTHSAVFDGLATVVIDETMIKAIIWFDNGWGYAARAVELMEKLAEFTKQEVSS